MTSWSRISYPNYKDALGSKFVNIDKKRFNWKRVGDEIVRNVFAISGFLARIPWVFLWKNLFLAKIQENFALES